MKEIEEEIVRLVGSVLKHEVERRLELWKNRVRLNRVFSLMDLTYGSHMVRAKRDKVAKGSPKT
jgi:phage baseplate assembly protein W